MKVLVLGQLQTILQTFITFAYNIQTMCSFMRSNPLGLANKKTYESHTLNYSSNRCSTLHLTLWYVWSLVNW